MNPFASIARAFSLARRDPLSTLGFWKALGALTSVASVVANLQRASLWIPFALLAAAALSCALACAMSEMKRPQPELRLSRELAQANVACLILFAAVFGLFARDFFEFGGLVFLVVLASISTVLFVLQAAAAQIGQDQLAAKQSRSGRFSKAAR